MCIRELQTAPWEPITKKNWRGLGYLANVVISLHHLLDARCKGVSELLALHASLYGN